MKPKLNLLSVVVFSAGVVLVYSAVKDKNPIEVIKLAIQGSSPAAASAVKPSSAPAATPSATIVPAGNNGVVPGQAVTSV